MEKEKNQVKKLKFNIKNIRSFLFGSNKTLKKTKQEKFRLIDFNKKEESFREKEKKIETPKLKSPLASVTSFILSGPMSIFDKLKEFFGIILLGLLVNNLPKIIQKIKEFFNNPFIQGTLKVLEIIGKGLYEIIKSVVAFPEIAQKNIKKETQKIKKDIDYLLQTFGFIESDTNKEIDKQQGSSSGQKQQKPSTPPSVPLTTPGAPTNPTPQSASQPGSSPLGQAFSKGGTVKKPKIKQNRFAAGGTVNKPKKSTAPTRTTSFSKRETGKAKKARQDMNYFEGFNRGVKDLLENTILDTKNNDVYEDMVNNFKKLTDMMKGDKDKKTTTPQNPGGPGPGPGLDLAIDVKPDEIIGYVGDTGTSGGAHIHIEDYEKGGTAIPQSVKSSILVAGQPMTSGTRTSAIGPRSAPVPGASTNHKGEDWDQNWNGKSISLTGGLKFVNYVPMGSDSRFDGYGNVTIIKAPNGRKYFLGHLSKGPKDIQALRQRQLQKQSVSQDMGRYTATGKKESGQASWYGPGFQGKRTASGETFDTNQFTAAHPTLPFGSKVKVTNPSNGKVVIVRINDRGPFAVDSNGKAIKPLRPHPSRIIDLSKAAMESLGGSGVINIQLETVKDKPIPKPGQKDFIGPVSRTPSANFEGTGPSRGQNAFLPLNNTETQIAMVMTTQPIIQPYPVPYMVPIKSPAPVSSGPPALSGAWSDLG